MKEERSEMKEMRTVPVLSLYFLIKETSLSFQSAYQFIENEMECENILEDHHIDIEDHIYDRLFFRLMRNRTGLNMAEIQKIKDAERTGKVKWKHTTKSLFDLYHDLLMSMLREHLEYVYKDFYQDMKMQFQCELYFLIDEYKKNRR